MMKAFIRSFVSAVCFVAALAGTAAAQDFQKDYRIPADGHIRIGNVSGDINVNGYDGDAVVVRGFKEGRNRDDVEIEDRSTPNSVEVKVRYPKHGRTDASVRFEVQVPRGMSFNFDNVSSVSGDVTLHGVSGLVRASTVSGSVRVEDMKGRINASSVSGNLEVEIERLEGTSDMRFSTVSGNITVKMPSNLEADIEMSTLSGLLKSDFPIEVREKQYGPGRSARGRIGDATKNLRLSSVSGNVILQKS
ncbi:MAG TPA: DUF4097 family beta strand repeat-containing protein [Blastocatellia bacterium]|nr:DUF4097 family beta strand repeat-containing protein [Blastocatellia bacterium]